MLDTTLDIALIQNNLQPIVTKILNQKRISEKEGLILYNKAPLSLLGVLANAIREQKNRNKTFFNKNISQIHFTVLNVIRYCLWCYPLLASQ